jgi:catechol 2,3-dioxygenase-like lactoylglutathione lyase family enzyme
MNQECHHIGLFSRYPDKLLPFYTEKLGFEHRGAKLISKEWMTRIFGMPAECQLIKLCCGSAVVEIFVPLAEGLQKKTIPSVGYNHWGLGVDDKEAYVRQLEEKGVSMLKLEGTGKFIYFIKDPEGNLIEVYQK